MNPVETYIRDLRDIHGSGAGVPETSYYPALSALFNELGKKLKPKVRCILQLADQGAGLPDGGLFTQEQFQRAGDQVPRAGQVPSRGAIEVKSPADEVEAIARSPQVAKYVQRYGQVLVTNLRDFLLVVKGKHGKPTPLEGFRLAASADSFWRLCAQPKKAAAQHGERLAEFLTRVMLHAAPLAEPKDVAWFLASYAREARARLEESLFDPLPSIRAALEDALGIRFSGEKGEHFFRSTFVQTLFYGVFSAWVLWSKQAGGFDPAARFNWRETAQYLHVPFLRALYYQLANPGPLKDLGLAEVLGWAEQVLNRVDRPSFFAAFEEGQAVQYFYEPFLEAFDPSLRKELGVWYTPTEVVQYMVARVDTVLREELDIPDGLADPQVYVLDPCCGTGAYLVEVLKRIAATLREKGEDALLAQDLKKAALERVIGFEILTAPFVVSHLQLGLLLDNLGAPLKEDESERVGVYLTNALTGWEPPSGPKARLPFKEFEEEREAADAVKRERPILVVLGNPPYNGFAGMAVEEERELSNAYRTTQKAPPPQGQGLNDLYVRFYRMAERRIVEMSGKGVVCFISNYSWLDGRSFTGMREHYLDAFDRIWIDCLNGDKYKTGKLTPWGESDPSVFSTKANPEGIQVGTAVALLVRKKPHQAGGKARFRHLWGKEKRADLLASAPQPPAKAYDGLKPALEMGLPLVPGKVAENYVNWPTIVNLFPNYFPGVQTKRDDLLIDIDLDKLKKRIYDYFNHNIGHFEMGQMCPRSMDTGNKFEAEKVREYLQRRGILPQYFLPYLYRPFDKRWIYWEPETNLLGRKSPDYFPHIFNDNKWISSGKTNRKNEFYQPQVSVILADHHLVESNVVMVPLLLKEEGDESALMREHKQSITKTNVTSKAMTYLSSCSLLPEQLFSHVLVVLHSQNYIAENAGALRQDWPRVPLPAGKEALLASADLGRQLAGLLDPESQVSGVTKGDVRPELKNLAVISREGGGQLDLGAGDLAVTAGWGHAGRGGITMPGKGRAQERAYTPGELAALERGAEDLGLTSEQVLEVLGSTTFDIYLNERALWRNVPKNVWTYTIGGYQVIKKWLSYRERPLLGRDLTSQEARYVGEVARRIAAILLLGPALDQNYQTVKSDTYRFPQGLN